MATSARPRTWLLVLLGVAVVGLLVTRAMTRWPGDAPNGTTPPRGERRAPTAPAGQEPIEPEALDVRLEALESPRPAQADGQRNPFRFQPRAAPQPPPSEFRPPTGPMMPPQPVEPPVPPIPWKLMGFVTVPTGDRLASLADCKGGTWAARQGEIVDGQYRVVSVGIESIVIEYLNGKGRQTLRVEGCPPR